MKFVNKALIMVMLTLLFSCKDDNGKADQPQSIDSPLQGRWYVEDASSVSGPAAELFTDFEVTFTKQENKVSYVSNSSQLSVFPASGSFELIQLDEIGKVVEVNRFPDNVPVTFSLLSENKVRLEFVVEASSSNGRLASIAGSYEFTLIKSID